MSKYLQYLRGDLGQWGVAFAAVAAYIVAAESGDYKTGCLVILLLLASSLAIFKDKGGIRDGENRRPNGAARADTETGTCPPTPVVRSERERDP